jgi:exosortase
MMKYRNIGFFLITAAVFGWTVLPLKNLMTSKAGGRFYDYYSHIYLIPVVSAYLFYIRREEIRRSLRPDISLGAILSIAGLIGYGCALLWGKALVEIDQAAWQISALLTAWLGIFLLFWGKEAFRAALFPLLFLFFLVPVPRALMDGFIYVLQVGSTWVTAWIFSLLGVSYYQEGFIFELGRVTIEVAKECSGIRSTMAMVITGILAAYLFLGRNRNRLILMLTILPITILKNGIRIVTLTLLAIYVDQRFLTGGFLHKSGGFLFYIPGLLIFGAILLWLRKKEPKG